MRCGIEPQEIIDPIAFELADSCDLPGWAYSAQINRRAGAAIGPNESLSSRVVVPEDVGLTVAVEVAGAAHLPLRVRTSAKCYGVPILHIPINELIGGGVAPENVVNTIAVEI